MLKDFRSYLLGAIVFSLTMTGCSSSTTTTPPAAPSTYAVTPMIADTAGFGATVIDTNLKNPWGIVNAPNSKFFVSNNHSGGIGEYDPTTGAHQAEFAIAGSAGANPTGIVYNADANSFVISGSGSSTYVFASEDGIIWGLSNTSLGISVGVDQSATSSFKGIALGARNGAPALYAANFKNGSLDLFDNHFSRVGQFGDTISGTSAIPSGATGFAPFNAAVLNGTLYVTYAKQKGDGDDLAGPGNGYIDIFNADGTFQKRLVSQGNLNSPWGMAIAPTGFGDVSGKLLVGNFGDGKINVYDPATGAYVGQFKDASGNAIVIDGLWGLYFNNGVLYYTAGAQHEAHGVLGRITLR